MKGIRHNGSDITDALLPFGRGEQSLTEVEVVLTTHGPEIGGTVVDDRNRPVAEAVVVAFAPDRGEWYGNSRFIGYADAGRDGSDLVILDATDFGGRPVATVALPQRVPFGFHGTWLPISG